jgi:hypothetical protein
MTLRTLTSTLLLLLAVLPLNKAYSQTQGEQPIDREDINTVLMQSTFKIEGTNGQGSVLGTAFIFGQADS